MLMYIDPGASTIIWSIFEIIFIVAPPVLGIGIIIYLIKKRRK